jgi:D-psicose/D-tagatose/L-ribulose 3-epimerase
MKIAISNIAWNKEEDKMILSLMKKYSISGVEIAPTKIWENPTTELVKTIKAYRKFWENEGISISSTQALLFGHPELTIFENSTTRNRTLAYLEKMIEISSFLGAEAMVFGSPKNRDRKDIAQDKALEIAAKFFYKLGETAKSHNIFFCIEPNPKEYGTNFVNNTEEAITLVDLVNHPYFRLHLDSGAMYVNKENYESAITQGFPYLKHFHISEKNLHPIDEKVIDHRKLARILRDLQYHHWVSVEMRQVENAVNDKTVEETLKLVSEIYL